jgi:hypothetical protein
MDINLQRIVEDEYNIASIMQEEQVSTGLINITWKLLCESNASYILQEINTNVFCDPFIIDRNIKKLQNYMNKESNSNDDKHLLLYPLITKTNNTVLIYNDKYYRLYNYINSKTITIISNKDLAYEAAYTFGKFTKLFDDFDPNQLELTIPDFHNLLLRYQQFETAIGNGNKDRINIAQSEIESLRQLNYLCDKFTHFIKHAKLRIQHHDTKITNILFDNNDKAICVIDLDTVMAGYFISDLGDMIRTYVCAVDENEADLDKINIKEDYLQALIDGYLKSMGDSLTEFEKDHIFFSGEVLLYMQSLRFLTDYLHDDKYYKISYDNHNYVRARNQLCLLQHLQSYIKGSTL